MPKIFFYYFVENSHLHQTQKDSTYGGGWCLWVFPCSGSGAWSGGGGGDQQASSRLMGTDREQRRGTSLTERAATDAIIPASCRFRATGQRRP